MDTGQHGINVEDFAILRGSLVPFALQFESFGIELVNLEGKRGLVHQVLGGSQGEVGKGMGGGIEHLRVAGKLAHQNVEELERS